MVDLILNHWSANRGAMTGDNGSYLLTGIPEGTVQIRGITSMTE